MSTEQEATPPATKRPWEWENMETECWALCTPDGCCGHDTGIPETLFPLGIKVDLENVAPDDYQQWVVDAEFAVRAVNSFDTMRDALREIAKGPEQGGYAVDAIRGLMEIASSALASIDGKDS